MRVCSNTFTLDWISLASFRNNLYHILKEHAVANTHIDSLGLVFTEYLTNLLKHADGLDKKLQFEVFLLDTDLTLILCDKTPFNRALFEEQHNLNQDESCKPLREGGMGIELIKSLFKDYQYQREGDVNRFEITVKAGVQRPKVMLIDDAQATLQLIQAYLSDSFEVETYEDPEFALTQLIHSPPDIVIVDIYMPKLSGEKLIEKVRHHEKLKNTKIVVLTGNPEAEKAQKANLLGIDAMLSKPTSKKEIQRVLTMLLSSKSVGLTQEVMPNSTFSKLLGQVRLSSRGSVNLKDSGDMLFEFKRTDEHFLILVDVMGHGEKASLIRDKLSGFFSGVITANITSPAAIMEVFSNALFEDLIAGETIIPCVICKIRHRSVEWVAAGHPAPILLSHSREAHLSEEVQALPGMHNAQLYQNYKFSLCDNQRLLLVTDGIFENQSRTNENASTIVEHVAHCENCQSQLRATNTLDSDNNLLNCIWRNSLPLLSKEIDDASLVLLS